MLRYLEDLARSLGLEANIEFKGYVTVEEKTRLIDSTVVLELP